MKKLVMILVLLISFHEAKSNVIDQFYINNIDKGITGSIVGLITGVPISLALNGNDSLILSGTAMIGAVVGMIFNFDNGKINIPKKEEKQYDFMNLDFNYFCDSKAKNQCVFMKKLIFVKIKY
jgi:hypothetical protein